VQVLQLPPHISANHAAGILEFVDLERRFEWRQQFRRRQFGRRRSEPRVLTIADC
jgi:hypothetical protein